ncbi:hypothetical protein C8Q77DRAFT_1156990 [Trametes polyzona]|nr:hypothetical protein C8Q77DRAFT_1156990 [Trametes polyzona]
MTPPSTFSPNPLLPAPGPRSNRALQLNVAKLNVAVAEIEEMMRDLRKVKDDAAKPVEGNIGLILEDMGIAEASEDDGEDEEGLG